MTHELLALGPNKEPSTGIPQPSLVGMGIALLIGALVVLYAIKKKDKQWPDIGLGVFASVAFAAAFPQVFLVVAGMWAYLWSGVGDAVVASIHNLLSQFGGA